MVRIRKGAGFEPTKRLSDIISDDMVHIVVVRSPVSCGKIMDLIFPDLPDNYYGLTSNDIPGENILPFTDMHIPVLASEKVKYKGEPVGILIGPNRDTLDVLKNKTIVKIEKIEPVYDFENILPENIVSNLKINRGDAEYAFEESDFIVQKKYTMDSQVHLSSETHGAFCHMENNKFIIQCATQWPSRVQQAVALFLGLNVGYIDIRPTIIGAHMDSKIWFPCICACLAALSTLTSKKPSRILFSREENFLFSPRRTRSVIEHKSSLAKDGTISGMEVKITMDIGAYSPFAKEILHRACIDACGVYNIPNIKIDAIAVQTNTPPKDFFAGIGSSQTFFAIESHIDQIAMALDVNPGNLRTKIPKYIKLNNISDSGKSHSFDPYENVINKLMQLSDYSRKQSSYHLLSKRGSSPSEFPSRGIGLALTSQRSGIFSDQTEPSECRVELSLDSDLKLTITIDAFIGSRGVYDYIRTLTSSILGIPVSTISIICTDFSANTNYLPSAFSNGINITGRLIQKACMTIKRKKQKQDAPWNAVCIYKPKKDFHDMNDILEQKYEDVSIGGAVVEVEMNSWDFQPKVLKIWFCTDCGTIVCEKHALRAIETGIINSLSQTLKEKLIFGDSDQAIEEYEVLSIADVPPIQISFLENTKKQISKGIGELPYSCVPAALIQAIIQATNFQYTSIPFDTDFPGADLELQ